MLRFTLSATVLLALAVGAVVAWGDLRPAGPRVAATRTIAPFHGVAVHGSTRVEIRPGRAVSLTVRGPRRAVRDTITTVRHGVLTVRRRSHHGVLFDLDRSGVTVVAHTPTLTTAAVDGSGDIDAASLRASRCTAVVRGSGSITARGACPTLAAEVDGSGRVSLSGVRARAVTSTVRGSGDVAVRASESLRASVDGSGAIRYAGEPPRFVRNVDGSGDVTPISN